MKHKIFYVLFLVCGLALCLFPLLGLTVTGPAPAAANEMLALLPSVRTERGGFNWNFLSDLSDYFADHFSCRQELITLNAALEKNLLGESASEQVVCGSDGWLYYAETLDDYQGQNRLSDRQIWAAAHTLALIQESVEGRGAAFLFTVVPNKNTVYPDHMPARYLRAFAPGNRERLFDALAQSGVRSLDLTPIFQAEDETLYLKRDSHWTNLGAALACDAICSALGRSLPPQYDPSAFTARRDYAGDLYAMLYPTGTGKDLQTYPKRAPSFSYADPIRSPEDQRILTRCEGQTGALLMFRDSFGNSLHSFLAESFGQACFSRAMPYRLTLLSSVEADTVVIELVERNIPWLAERAPIFEAPQRELTLPEQTPGCAARVTRREADGLFVYSGELDRDPDVDSPVYLVAGGAVYEASPVGETGRSFTACLPVCADTVEAVYVKDGSLQRTAAAVCTES